MITLGDADERLIVEVLLPVVAVPGDEAALLGVLTTWATDASENGTGGDLSTLREYLNGTVRLAVAPSFRADVEKLRAYSAAAFERVRRFRALHAPEGDLAIERLVTDAVVASAAQGSFLITGEPGAGKSAILHAAAERLSASAPIIFLPVEATATSLDNLRREIGLEHPVVEVLRAFDGNRPAFLFIDALDAARGGLADATYRRLIEEVSVLDGWHVVASVRSFDLRLGRELKALFTGLPPVPNFAETDFRAVRHIHVPVLSDAEIEQVEAGSSSVVLALQSGGAKLRDLVRNPFNLSLLSDLLTDGVQASSLAAVTTRGQLLERYWEERIADLGLPAEVALADIVNAMLDRNSTNVAEVSVNPASANIVQDLAGRGVLVREITRRLAFRHHVLYDYAIARLVLSREESTALERLSRTNGAGLLLAPAAGYWLDERFRYDASGDFWRLIIHLTASSDIDPVIRIESARLAVELVTEPDDLDSLADTVMADPDGRAAQAAVHLIGAILARSSTGHNIPPLPWANFAARMRPLPQRLIFAAQSLLSVLLEPAPVPEAVYALGLASRELMDALLADENLAHALAAHAIGFVARTYATDPDNSRRRLAALFEPGRFARIGYAEVPWLAREIRIVADVDPAFATDIYQRVFSAADFDRNQPTPMGNSWIMSTTSNAGQDFDMARHFLASAYGAVLESDHLTGARILSVALNAERQRKQAPREGDHLECFEVNGQECFVDNDNSYVWALNVEEKSVNDYAKIYRAFLDWSATALPEQLVPAIDTLLAESSIALTWRCAFTAGVTQPTSLGLHLWPFVSRPEFLSSLDTRQSAIALIAAVYPHLPVQDRECFETAAESFDFSRFQHPEEVRSNILSRVFAAIGDEHLVTESARRRLATAIEQGQPLSNDLPISFQTSSRQLERHEWISGDISGSPNSEVLALNDRIEDALTLLEVSATPERMAELEASLMALDQLVESAKAAGLLTDVDCEASDTLARGAEALLKADSSAETRRGDLVALLLRLSAHPLPETSRETEEDYARSPGWGSPCPRIRAAEALASIMALPGVWPNISDVVERLALQDPHPAVRAMVIRVLHRLRDIQRDEMWRLIDEVSRQEQNTSVLRDLLHVLWCVIGSEPERVETLFLSIFDRIAPEARREEDFAVFLVHFGIVRNLPLSHARLEGLVTEFEHNEECLQAAVFHLRDLLVLGYKDVQDDDVQVGTRTRAFAAAVLDRIESALRSWPSRGGEPQPEELAAFKLLDTLADAFFYGTGAGGRREELALKTHTAQAAFVRNNAALIRRMTQLGTPRTVHHLLELLEAMVAADPGLCFDLICDALLHPAGVAQYEHEPLGAELFVRLVGLYLADHRGLFADDIRRQRLVDCLAVFVEAGWTEARRLFQRLPELLL